MDGAIHKWPPILAVFFWYLNTYLLPISDFALFYTIYVFRVDVRISAMDAKAPVDF